MAAPVVRADREPVLPVRTGVNESRAEVATIRAPAAVAPATIGVEVRGGANRLVLVAAASRAGISDSRRKGVVG